jgi:hypothetical protein
MNMEDKESNRLAMDEEMTSLGKNDTWDLVPLLMDGNPLDVNEYSKRRLV